MRQLAKLKKLKIDLDFSEIAVKGRASKGNIVTKFPIKRIELKEKGESTLEARKIWFDSAVQRLNGDDRGRLLGSFRGEDRLLVASKNGTLRVVIPELALHFDADMMYLEKLMPQKPISAVYFDGEKSRYFAKRFDWEGGDKEENIVTAHPKSELVFLSNDLYPRVEMVFRKQGGELKEPEMVELTEFISVKGIKAKGNQLTTDSLNKVMGLGPLPEPELIEEITADIEETPVEITPVESVSKQDISTAPSVVPDSEAYDADGKAPQITLDF